MQRPRRLGLTPRGWIVSLIILVLAYLEFAPRLGWIDSFSLPPFSEILVHAGKLLVDGPFWATDLFPTLLAMGLSFVIASLLGVIIGLILWRFPPLRRVVDPWLTVYYAIPIFAVYPMIVVLAGVGLVPIVFLATLLAIVAVITATIDGLDSTPPMVLKLSDSLQLSPIARTVKILLPSAVEQINVGLRLALSFSIIGVLASEFILSTHGLGHFISNASEHFNMGNMYGGILLVLIFAFGLNMAFSALLRKRTRRIQG
ncbi:hypothetical protein ASG74_15020 [Knoellia sp. Soil729]|nr:hypothetical protein ASG74_15020 [Knoellia sp. Soil729]